MAQEIADSKLIDTWSSDGLKVKPDISKIIEGWQLGEQPPHEYMNWLQNTFGSKLNHILKNGVASWNNETEYLAGSSVQHNGNVWLCKTTNTNSAPTDANANWKRIITVESLTSTLSNYLALTGEQTVEGSVGFVGNVLVTSSEHILGYGLDAGGTVTQLTSKSTAVTLNKPAGAIVTHNASLASGAKVGFVLNNILINNRSIVIPQVYNNSNYSIECNYSTNGVAFFTITNNSLNSLSQPITIKFITLQGQGI